MSRESKRLVQQAVQNQIKQQIQATMEEQRMSRENLMMMQLQQKTMMLKIDGGNSSPTPASSSEVPCHMIPHMRG